MKTKIFLPGVKVDLIKINRRTKLPDEEKIFYSQVLDYDNSEKIELSVHIIKGKIIPLEPDEEYLLRFYTERGLYQCKGQIITRYKKENLCILVMLLESDLERLQRRRFYRLECFWEVLYACVNDNHSKESIDEYGIDQMEWKIGMATDISGGGCCFNSDMGLKKDTCILLRLGYPTLKTWEGKLVEARVVDSKKLLNKQGLFENRVEFINISNSDREKIIRVIFEEERKIRQRERGYT